MTPILDARSITSRVGPKTLIDSVSLSFGVGEAVALVGPNGAGKTTLLRLISGALRPSAGTVWLKGRGLAAYRPHELAVHRAVLSQSISVAFPFTVAEMVRMGAGDRSGRRIDERVDEALANVGLEDFRERIVTTLSGGEQQRVHFARVMVQLAIGEEAHGPGVLLLDEPTAGLDLKHQIELLEFAKSRAAQGNCVIAVLHDLNLATLFGKRIIVLKDGRVDCDGEATETITSDVIERVFGVPAAVGRLPRPGTPFILPQATALSYSG